MARSPAIQAVLGRLSYDYGVFIELIEAYLNVAAVDVDFSADVVLGEAPLTVQFTNDTVSYVDIDFHTWDFSDGSPPGQQNNPEHVFTEPGSYTIILVETDVNGVEHSEIKFNYITVLPPTPPL